MEDYVKVGNLHVATVLYEFINLEALPGSGVDLHQFWSDFERLIIDLVPKNKKLLKHRETIQQKINKWHKENKNFDMKSYQSFLEEIGYLEPEVADFQIQIENVDEEVAIKAGPQLVVPVDNARFALNAANARWGSLYDALYGTDAISDDDGAARTGIYNPVRGSKVIAFGRDFLNQVIPLEKSSHNEVIKYIIQDGTLEVSLNNGLKTRLKDENKLVGYQGNPDSPTAILFKNNGLYFEIQFDGNHPIGKIDHASIKDILLESALTTIMDCEDSVAAVDAQDKVLVYRNWLGLMKGNLTASYTRDDKTLTRKLSRDRIYCSAKGEEFSLKGRSLMFVRNVGHLMTTSAVLNEEGGEIPEGILDTVCTSLAGKHSLLGTMNYQNSSKGSIYIVKPKMHGSEEVAFANELFNNVEDMLGLQRHTLKIGVMDEERRTSLNLKACIRQVKDRVVFINTGFLDRTGDEIHTSMEVGPMIRKNNMKSSPWIKAYEKSNVDVGLTSGLQGKAQIGKGMWAMPDLMAEMLKQKIGHLNAGANTAWVPSPTAATLHVLHYHQVDVAMVQVELAKDTSDLRNEILEIPVSNNPSWSPLEIQQELDNNAQGILGYVVRWIDQGIGCSKVLDIDNVALMEDRATLRISSQHIANWLHHGICSKELVLVTLKRMAQVVDKQNLGDINYHPMSQNLDQSIAFQTACDLIFKGHEQPNGYTEPILHRRRIEAKNKLILSQ
ncbi:malate synthase G [Psychrobacillus sp. NPDC093180]|uniref:malate synthase G n=1 Tax=Psychrobacillus sp. NPDC093180 TaxID=3364489 RepID=UPI003828355C